MDNKSDSRRLITDKLNSSILLVLHSIPVGIIAGIIVIAYRLLLEKASTASRLIYAFLSENIIYMPLWMLVLLFMGLGIGFIIRLCPLAGGSGIPQIAGELANKLDMNWWQVLLSKFIGGIISIAAGLSLGRQGPSVQIGAALGKGYSKLLGRSKTEESFLMTGGAAAGLSAAFGAPFAGVMFSLEILHKGFSPNILASVTVACISADVVTKNFFGLKPLFDFRSISVMQPAQYIALLALGAVLGVLGCLFNGSMYYTQKAYQLTALPSYYRPVIPFILAGIVGIYVPQVLGGGQFLIEDLTARSFGISVIITILTVKYIYTLICLNSGAPGGIFMPVMVIGSLLGNLFGYILIFGMGYDHIYLYNFIAFAMAGYFTAIVKAPITACVLIIEMTGSFEHLTGVMIVCITSYIVSDLLGTESLYQTLLAGILKNHAFQKPIPENQKSVV
ncbi:MAG: ClC family H(+)/Cl(-) exchange transporter [Bacillota bacterium]